MLKFEQLKENVKYLGTDSTLYEIRDGVLYYSMNGINCDCEFPSWGCRLTLDVIEFKQVVGEVDVLDVSPNINLYDILNEHNK